MYAPYVRGTGRVAPGAPLGVDERLFTIQLQLDNQGACEYCKPIPLWAEKPKKRVKLVDLPVVGRGAKELFGLDKQFVLIWAYIDARGIVRYCIVSCEQCECVLKIHGNKSLSALGCTRCKR